MSEPPDSQPERDEQGSAPLSRGKRLAVTLLGPVAVVVGEWIPLPGMDMNMLDALGDSGGASAAPTLTLSAVGIGPILAAAVVVELVAWLVQGWNAHRLSGFDGRRKLWRVTVTLGLLLAALQAYGLARLLDLVGQGYASAYAQPGLAAQITLVATWLGATCCYLLLAQLISARGLANGFVVLLVSFVLYGGVDSARHQALAAAQRVPDHNATAAMLTHLSLQLGGIILVIAATTIVLWPRPSGPSRLPAPASGSEAIPTAASLLASPTTLLVGVLGIWFSSDVISPVRASPLFDLSGSAFGVVWLVGVLLLTVALAVEFYWPSRVAAAWRRAGVSAPEPRLGFATFYSLVFVLALHTVQQVQHRTIEDAGRVALVALATALVLDMAREWRARGEMSSMVPVWPEQRPYVVSAACQALARHGIESHARSFCQRRLLQGFGPYVPIEICVPHDRAHQARGILEKILPLAPETERHVDRGESAAATDTVLPRPWRRIGALAAIIALAFAGGVGGHHLLTRLAELPTDVAPVKLEFIGVDDGADPLAAVAASDESALPAGLTFSIENAPLGPGRTQPIHYAMMRTVAKTPPPELVAFLDAVPTPPSTRFLLSRWYDFDDASGQVLPSGWRSFLVFGDPVLTGDNVRDARARADSGGMGGAWFVDLQFDDEGAERFRRYTAEHVKRRFAIVVDGIVTSAPVIQEEIGGGRARITMGAGSFEQQRDEARRLAAGLRAGAARRRR